MAVRVEMPGYVRCGAGAVNAVLKQSRRVHIRHVRITGTKVSPLTGEVLVLGGKSTQNRLPLHPALRCAAGSLTPALFRGHATKGHPWPCAACSASCRASPGTAPAFGLLGGASESFGRLIHGARKSRSRQTTRAQALLGIFMASDKISPVRSETILSVGRRYRICTPWRS